MAHLFIERARSAPLKVEVTSGCPKDLFWAIRSRISHIQELKLSMVSLSDPLLLDLMDKSAPLLKVLEVYCMALHADGSSPSFPPVVPLPRLERLVLDGFTAGQSFAYLTNLTELHLINRDLGRTSSMTQLLNTVEGNPGLVALSIGRSASEIDDGYANRIVYLPALKTLNIANCAVPTILAHLDLPEDAKIAVDITEDPGWHPGFVERTLPKSLVHLPNLRGFEKMGIRRLNRKTWEFYGMGKGSLSVKACFSKRAALEGSFLDSLKPLSTENVRELWLEGIHGYVSAVQIVQLSLQALEKLTLVGCDSVNFIDALELLCPARAYPSLIDLTIHDGDRSDHRHVI